MRKVVAGLFMSLDGVVESVDGWEEPYFDDELHAALAEGSDRIEAVVVGRRTFEGYEQLRDSFPDAPILGLLDATPTYVVSSTLRQPPRSGTHLLDADVPARIARLRHDGDGVVQVLGSPTLVRSLWADGLLDELEVLLLPIQVGAGARLFADGEHRRRPLALLRSRVMGNGVVRLVYGPDR